MANTASLPSGLFEAGPSNTQQRHSRHLREHDRLVDALSLLINAQPKCELVGVNKVVADLARHYRLDELDYVPMSFRLGSEFATAIAVPTRVWYHQRSKSQILLLKRDLGTVRHRCILVPERVVRRQPRLSNLQLLNRAQHIVASPTDHIRIVQQVLESGGAPIIDCASVVAGGKPVETVLSLVAAGHLAINILNPFGPFTMVYDTSQTSLPEVR